MHDYHASPPISVTNPHAVHLYASTLLHLGPHKLHKDIMLPLSSITQLVHACDMREAFENGYTARALPA